MITSGSTGQKVDSMGWLHDRVDSIVYLFQLAEQVASLLMRHTAWSRRRHARDPRPLPALEGPEQWRRQIELYQEYFVNRAPTDGPPPNHQNQGAKQCAS
jgi:hypothetical protein